MLALTLPRPPRAAVPIFLATLSAARALPGQVIQGRIVDDATGAGVAAVTVVLVGGADDAVASAVSDSAGAFRLAAPQPGEYALRAERIGYATASTAAFAIGPQELLDVEIRIGAAPILLAPLAITGRRRYGVASLEAFHRRAELYGRPGFGHFITRAEIEATRYSRVSDYLRRVPGVAIRQDRRSDSRVLFRRGGRDCPPRIYLDGLELSGGVVPLDQVVRPADLEGIEVYRGPATPAEFHDPNNCGVLLAWTRQDRPDRPWSWKRLLIGAAGLLTVGFLVFR